QHAAGDLPGQPAGRRIRLPPRRVFPDGGDGTRGAAGDPRAALTAPVERRNLFDQQARNRRATWLLITAFVGLLALPGLGFDLFATGTYPLPLAALAAAVFGAGSAWAGYQHGDRAVLAGTGARPPAAGDPNVQVLRNVVDEMAIAAGIPRPRLWIVDD